MNSIQDAPLTMNKLGLREKIIDIAAPVVLLALRFA
jgi:hypothetical protein